MNTLVIPLGSTPASTPVGTPVNTPVSTPVDTSVSIPVRAQKFPPPLPQIASIFHPELISVGFVGEMAKNCSDFC